MPLWAVFAGCTGADTFSVPEYVGGVLVEGDCLEDPPQTNLVDTTVIDTRDGTNLFQFDHLPDVPGLVFQDEASYEEFMFGIGYTTIPILPFPSVQAVAVWYHQPRACALTVEPDEVDVVSHDGGVTLDVQFFDAGLNCDDDACTEDLSAIVIRTVETDAPVSVCRRVRPGCLP